MNELFCPIHGLPAVLFAAAPWYYLIKFWLQAKKKGIQ